MRSHRLAAPSLAFVLGAAGVLAIGGAALAVSPNTPAAPAVAVAQNVCGTMPIDVEIILDTSGSMGSNSSAGETRLHWAQAAATQLVSDLSSHGGVGDVSGLHHVGLTTFSGTTSTVRLALGTSTAAQVDAAIGALTATGNTPFKTGMATGAADLTTNGRTTANSLLVQHVIIFLSDGRPNPDPGQRPSATDIANFQNSADTIYSIAIGQGGSGSSQVDLALMQSLAKPASGHYFNVVDSNLLPTLFSSIFTQIACPNLVITASSDTMTYGGTVPTITPSYSGFVSPDTAASLATQPTCTTTATSSSPVGTYPSSCSGAVDSKYNISYVDGTVGVTPAPLVITASSGTMTVGGTVPTITPSYSGFVSPDTDASLTTAPTCTTTATTASPVGTYPSSCSGAVDPNYAISYVPGTVTVTAPDTTAPPATTAPPTVAPTVVPSQSLEGATATPTTAPTKAPTQVVGGVTSAPSATVPATSSGGAPGGGSGSPLFALLIALVFGGLGFMAVEAQRRSTRG
jgi:Mg-chelatase subunit ChlD